MPNASDPLHLEFIITPSDGMWKGATYLIFI